VKRAPTKTSTARGGTRIQSQKPHPQKRRVRHPRHSTQTGWHGELAREKQIPQPRGRKSGRTGRDDNFFMDRALTVAKRQQAVRTPYRHLGATVKAAASRRTP
jgi:hypothetical protein